MFSVNVLLYGAYTHLAERCLLSIMRVLDAKRVTEVRIGMNAVAPATSELARRFCRGCAFVGVPCYLYAECTHRNVLKYPIMRKMLYDPDRPVTAPLVMWFDDDSFVDHDATWFAEVEDAWNENSETKCKVMGAVYRPGYWWTDLENIAIRRQPWYGGQPLDSKHPFVTGGWWVAERAFLTKCDYPSLELRHNGGDVLLGEMCRQQGFTPKHFKTGVCINYDKARGGESCSPRRGVTTARPFDMTLPYDYTHHQFEVTVETFGAG
jgi:hypothetical protein